MTRRRGSIYFADLGHPERKRVLVVSWNVINEVLRQPIVALVTSNQRERSLDTVVALEAGESGMRDDSLILCHSVVTIPESRLDPEPLGTLSAWKLADVERKLATVLDLHL